MMRPRIGITAGPVVHEDQPSEHVERAYIDAVAGGGGLPLILPVLRPADAQEALGGLDALVLSGGGDVEPSLYGEAPVPQTYGVRPDRDAWELALVAAAQALELPVLGVCRGLQVLNVAGGGTLVQHLPALTKLSHKEYERDREEVHTVTVAPASVVGSIAGQRRSGSTASITRLYPAPAKTSAPWLGQPTAQSRRWKAPTADPSSPCSGTPNCFRQPARTPSFSAG